MSLEWARARALGHDVPLREFLKSPGRKRWLSLTLESPAAMTIWVAGASADRRVASPRQRGRSSAKCRFDDCD
jgi:hypothetical protein